MSRSASATALLSVLLLSSLPTTIGCGSGALGGDQGDPTPAEDAAPPVKASELGAGDHSPGSVKLTEIAGPAAKLNKPRDLAFNVRRPDELWVVNLGDESMTLIFDASTDRRRTERRKDADAMHFMANPAAISFGADETTIGVPGTLSTCGESRNTYDGMKAPNDFMGPTLWSSDLSIFAMKNPFKLGSHLDMLHDSPNCMGLAHETANVYWAFSGQTNAIVKYDFGTDHGVGEDDHSDGQSWEYARGVVKYVPGVPSHLFFDPTDAMLYIADTGNGRISKLDTSSGTRGVKLPTKESRVGFWRMNGAEVTDVVPPSFGLVAPSGLEIKGDYVYVSDNATSRITAFTRAGEQVNYLDTGLPPGSLSGMAFGPDGRLYFVDILGNRVLRIDPPAP